MSIKIYDEKSGKYVTTASNWASGIKVLDTEGNFIDEDGKPSESVEQALKELAHKQRDLSERVEYIYENGTIGGGGGGGGSAIPTITLLSPVSETSSQQYATMEIPTNQEVTIQYSFQSPNIGNGTVYYIITGDVETRIQATISQGVNSYNFGNFATGTYAINIYVIDAGGMYSNTASVAIRSGSLEITSDFKETTDFTLMDEIEIRYTVDTVSREPIMIHMSVDGKESTREVESSGTYVWNAGLMSYTGIHELSLYATSGDYTSNTLTYRIIVGDTTSMFISSNFTETSIQEGRQIAIPYRVSMAGETRALVYKWINNVEQSVDTVTLGTGNYNFWNIGDQLAAGDYEFKIQATTLDGAILSNILTFNVEVAAESFARIRAVTDDSLMASFIADNKSSLASNRNVWEDDSDNNVSCQLYNFNHATNGWDGYSLNFDGRAYAVIDLQPWIKNCPYGFTFDIYYKVENIGNINAKVLWMKNNNTPYQGFYIDTQRANITSGAGRTIETVMRDSDSKQTNWQHVTFTVNRETRLMEIFVNGVISQAVRLNTSESFEFDGKIYLGGQFNSNNSTISEQGKMSVRAVHIYDRVLTDDEIVNNFIACLPYPAEQERVYRLNYDDQQIPRMDITGNLDNMTDDDTNTPLVGITYVDYADLTKSFELNQCKISIQGTSSQLYPVKNYTIQLRANGQDFYYAPKDAWKPFPRFTLKANYIDSSSANNIANARFFNDLISAYHPYPSQQIDGQCRGTVDGFPIRLYINDEYQGLYTFNIDRYAYNAYGFDLGDQTVAYEVAANTNTGAGAFFEQENDNATWNSIKQEFEYRYHYAGDEKIVCEVDATLGNQTVLKQGSYHTDLVNLVKWTSSATDEDFTGEIENHWSLNHLIDYFLTVYVVGLVDNFGKNMVIANFGKDVNMNVVWYVMMYDADSCLGLTNDGYLTKPASIDLENSGDFNTIESQLWQKIIDKQNGFWSRIIDRYAQLRYEGWFTTEKLLEYYNDNFIATIGQRFYNQDARLKYTKEENQTYMYMCNGSRLEYTKRWIEERLLYLDSAFDYITAYQKVASIRTNANDYLTLRMKAKSPRYIKIKWSDMLTYQKYFVSNDKYYEFTSPIQISNTDNNLDFQGIETITEIESFAHLKPSALHLSGMESLTNVDSHDSEFLREVTLESNKMLQTINLSGCENLGLNQSDEPTGNLNLINCSNLKYLDVSGTSLGSLNVIDIDTENPDASTAIGTGSLEYFDASGTGISDITIWNQSYLEEILMEDCHELATVSIGNCEKLRSMSLPNSQINKFTIVDCEELKSIDISNTAKLVELRLDGCPNLLSLNMRQVNSPILTNLDLTTVPILEELNVANTSFLEYITFADNFSSLKVFDMRNSVLKSIRFGKRGDFPTYLDLSPFKMTSVSFYNCPSLQEIRGIDYNGSGEGMFYNCYNLHTVQGSLMLRGNINRICYNCQALTNLPTLNMKEVTGASEPFVSCKEFTMTHVRTIMNSLGDKITTSWRMFSGCTKVIGEIPSDLFSTTPNFGNLNEFFYGCTGLTGTIPTSLFVPIGDRLTSVRYFVGGCTGMTGDLNNSMFSSNPNLQNTSYMFSGSKIGGVITNQLFSANPNLTDTSYMFNGVTTIQSRIPNGLFANNTKLQNCEYMFNGCTGLYGTLPQLFESSDGSNYALTNADYFLNGCTGIYGNIPSGLFEKCPELLRCSAFFRKTDIYGDIPNDIFSSCTKLTSAASFFAECTSMTSQIPNGLFHNLVALSDVSSFFDGCTNLFTEVPREMFYGCPNVQFMAGMFRNCQKLYGDIPTDLFDYSNKISSIASLFENCYNLTSEIPSNFFAKCGNVQDMSAVFRNDYNIQGTIPKGLFYGCVKAVNMSYMFENCKSLRKDLSEEMIYCVPEDLFIDCPNLENVNSMFYMWGNIGGGTKMTGEIPPRLFEPCSKLLYANYLFSAVPLTGELSDTVFYRSINLKEMNYAFASTGLTSIDDNVFINNKSLTKVEGLFRGCSSMQGNAYQFWNGEHPLITDYGQCYQNCTSLTDYETIPPTWK